MYISSYNINIIHTEPGIRQGFSFRYKVIHIIAFSNFFSIKIPFKFISYDKAQAKRLHRLISTLELEIKDGAIPINNFKDESENEKE